MTMFNDKDGSWIRDVGCRMISGDNVGCQCLMTKLDDKEMDDVG